MSFLSIVWYLEHKDKIDVALQLLFLISLIGMLYLGIQLFSDISSPYYTFAILALALPVGVIYYVTIITLRRRCSSLIHRYSSSFKEHPSFDGKVGEKLVDRLDLRILETIKDAGGSYSEFVPEVSGWFPVPNLFKRLGKLHALGYVQIFRDKVNMTPEGLDLLELPPLSRQASIPSQVASRMAQDKMNLSAGRFKDVIVDINKTLELLLRNALEASLGTSGKKKLKEISSKPYNRWTLGDLKAAASKFGVIDSTSGNILTSIIQLRNRFIHASRERRELAPETVALTIMNLSEAFVRYWYSGQ